MLGWRRRGEPIPEAKDEKSESEPETDPLQSSLGAHVQTNQSFAQVAMADASGGDDDHADGYESDSTIVQDDELFSLPNTQIPSIAHATFGAKNRKFPSVTHTEQTSFDALFVQHCNWIASNNPHMSVAMKEELQSLPSNFSIIPTREFIESSTLELLDADQCSIARMCRVGFFEKSSTSSSPKPFVTVTCAICNDDNMGECEMYFAILVGNFSVELRVPVMAHETFRLDCSGSIPTESCPSLCALVGISIINCEYLSGPSAGIPKFTTIPRFVELCEQTLNNFETRYEGGFDMDVDESVDPNLTAEELQYLKDVAKPKSWDEIVREHIQITMDETRNLEPSALDIVDEIPDDDAIYQDLDGINANELSSVRDFGDNIDMDQLGEHRLEHSRTNGFENVSSEDILRPVVSVLSSRGSGGKRGMDSDSDDEDYMVDDDSPPAKRIRTE